MNHIYRLVWNKKRRMLMAVAEIGNAQGKEAGADNRRATPGDKAAFPCARTLLAAAVMSLFPGMALAQSGENHVIAAFTEEYLFDSDGSNAAAAGWNVRNDGQLDISGTDAGTTLQSLSGSGAVLLGERVLTLSAAQGYYQGTIQGMGGLTVNGGVEILGGSNKYQGLTTVGSEATLALSGSGSIALSSGLKNDGVFDISATDQGTSVSSLSGSGAVLLGGRTLTLTNAGNSFAGAIQGNGGLNLSGALQLEGANTYTGVTAIERGSMLSLSGSGSIALSSGVFNEGILSLENRSNDAQLSSLSGSGFVALGNNSLVLSAANGDFAGAIGGAGGLHVAGGTEVLSGVNSYTGATTIAADGTLGLSGNGSIAQSSGVAVDGVFDIADTWQGAEVTSLSGSGAVLLGGQTLTLTQANDAFAGVLHGSGGLALAAGQLVLGGEQAYTGVTAIADDARLTLAGSGSIALSSNVLVDGMLDLVPRDGGAQLQSLGGSGSVLLGDADLTITNGTDRFNGGIHGIGAGGLVIAGGNQILAGFNTYGGATVIEGVARLGLSDSGSIALSSGVVANGVFDISTGAGGSTIRSLSGAGNVLLGGRTLTLSEGGGDFGGAIHGSGGLALGAGTQVLSGANSYSGDTAVAQGASLVLAGDGSIGNSRLVLDGQLDVQLSNGSAAVKSLSGSGAVLLGDHTLTFTHAGDVYAGSIHGSGGIAIAGGTQVLSGDNAFTGATAIAAGATLGLSGSGSLALSSGVLADGTLDIAALDAGASIQTLSGSGAVSLGDRKLTLTDADGNFTGVIRGAGGVTVAAGDQALGGRNSYTGDTTIASGAVLTLAGNGSIANSRVGGDGTLDVSLSSGNAAVKSLSGSGAVLLGGQTLTLTNAGDTYGGSITGAGGIAITRGTQVLAGDNRYTGLTTIGAGATLGLSGSGSLALSSGVVANGTLDLASLTHGAQIRSLSGAGAVRLGSQTLTLTGANGSFSGVIAGTGGLDLAGGTQTLGGRNSYSGATSIAAGATLALAGNGSIASSRVTGNGTLDITRSSGGAAVRSLAGGGTVLLGNQTLTLAHGGDTFGGRITGAGGIVLAAGNQTFSAAQGYTGTTTIAKGATLALSGNGSIAGSGVAVDGSFDARGAARAVTVRDLAGAGAVLLGANDLTVTGASGRFAGTIAGSGGLNVTGGKLALAGNNSYTGKTVVSNATLRTVADANLGAGRAALELKDGTWQTGADLTHTRGLLLGGRGTVDVDAGTTTVESGTVGGSGALVKQGAGTLVLNANNTYTGGTTIAGGVLRIGGDAALGAAGSGLTLDGGTLQTTGTLTSNRAIEVTAKRGVIDTLGADSVVTLDGNIDGAGRIVKEGAGTLVLAGDNAGGKGTANRNGDGWTGGLTINDGLVKVTHAYGLGWGSVMTFNAGTIHATVDIATGQDIRMGRSTDINVDANTKTTLTGDLISTGAGDGCFNKTGLGTLNVLGAAQIDATCVLEGKLLANGSFASRVTVARGATLGGAGFVQGDILVQGTLSPGNSPGMLTADANIVMATGSTYKQDIGGAVQASAATPVGAAGYYSFLQVVGGKQFTIQPGVTLAPALKDLYTSDEAGYGSAAYVPQLGQTFRIVTAQGGIAGRFDTLAQPDGLAQDTRMAAFYDQGGNRSIELKVLPKSYAAWSQDAGANSRAIGAALDRIADLDAAGKGSAAQTALLYNTASYGAERLEGVVRGLSGEVHGALAAALPQAGWELQRTLLKRGESNDGRALWLDLGAGRAKWSGDDAASSFHADRFQATAGLDLVRAPGLRLGLGLSHTNTSLDAEGGSGKLRQNKVFAYGEGVAGDAAVDLSASYGNDKLDSHRADPFDAAGLNGRADGNSAVLGAGLRLPRTIGNASYEPFARISVQRVERDALAETGGSAAALALDGWSATGTRLVAGLAGSSRNADPLQASTWRFNLGAGVDGGDLLRPQLGASLADSSFAVGAPDAGRVFVQGGLAGTLQLKKGAYLFLGVTGEARSGYYTVGGNAGVRAQF